MRHLVRSQPPRVACWALPRNFILLYFSVRVFVFWLGFLLVFARFFLSFGEFFFKKLHDKTCFLFFPARGTVLLLVEQSFK